MPVKAFVWKGGVGQCGYKPVCSLERRKQDVFCAWEDTVWHVQLLLILNRCVGKVILSLLFLCMCFSEDLYLSSSARTKHQNATCVPAQPFRAGKSQFAGASPLPAAGKAACWRSQPG